jgi:error-prone DNA polymerase
MGFYPPDALVHEAQRRGLEVLPPDVNASQLDCRVETTGAAPGSSGSPPVRVGLGYVAELAEIDAQAVLTERRRGGGYRSIADLAGRSGAGAAALQRLAWAGACDTLVQAGARHPVPDPDQDLRRPALWEAGAVAQATPSDDGAQLSLPLDGSPTPELPSLGPWERTVADYRTTRMTLGTHPMELLRPQVGPHVLSSDDLEESRDGSAVTVAGMVVARQRPATAKGVVFMLLEDERGTINLVVPPPVVERCRLAVRTAGFVLASGKLEHREGTTNVVVSRIDHLEAGEIPAPRPRQVAPPIERETGREQGQRMQLSKRAFDGVREAAMAELAASLPAPHSFGRRGR